MSFKLRKYCKIKGSELLPGIFISRYNQIIEQINNFISGERSVFLVSSLTILGGFFLQYNIFKVFQILPLSRPTAESIIDQRITNLSAIFSISLVVFGWIISNISIRESIAFKILFRRTYLYSIFYYIISLLAFLILSSLLRETDFVKLENVVAVGSYLMILALGLIVLLFIRLVKVVGPDFIYDSLRDFVLKEVKTSLADQAIGKLSDKKVEEFLQPLGLIKGLPYRPILEGYQVIKTGFVSKRKWKNNTYLKIVDIDVDRMTNALAKAKIQAPSYYFEFSIGAILQFDSTVLMLKTDSVDKDTLRELRKAIKFRSKREENRFENLEFLEKRFLKDVKEKNLDNVKQALKIYEDLFQLHSDFEVKI